MPEPFQFGFNFDQNDGQSSSVTVTSKSTSAKLTTTTKNQNIINNKTPKTQLNKNIQLSSINFIEKVVNSSNIHTLPYESIPLQSCTLQPLKRIVNLSSPEIETHQHNNIINSGDLVRKGKEFITQTKKEKIDLSQTDLVSGVYEGGLKVWECSLDLCHYLSKQISNVRQNKNEHGRRLSRETNKNPYLDTYATALSSSGHVMELGCGHGLPGCLLLRESDGNTVLFSDYNHFVLDHVTIPNILLNTMTQGTDINRYREIFQRRVALMGGDWMDLSDKIDQQSLDQTTTTESTSFKPDQSKHYQNSSKTEIPTSIPKNGRFDLILAAETTYTESAARDTAKLLGKHLKVDSGIGLVSMKRYYFGVGGGVDAFRKAAASILVDFCTCESQNETPVSIGRLEVQTLKIFDNGISNIREP